MVMKSAMTGGMGQAQRTALGLMREQNLGAVLTGLGWVWPNTVRQSEAAALAVVEVLCA